MSAQGEFTSPSAVKQSLNNETFWIKTSQWSGWTREAMVNANATSQIAIKGSGVFTNMSRATTKLYANIATIAAVIALLAFIPKPELIQYKSANLVSEAIYWDGFGQSGMLSDARAPYIKLDYQTNHLYICHETNSETERRFCQEFVVIKNDGLAGAIAHLLR